MRLKQGVQGVWPKEMDRTSRGQMASKLGTWGLQPFPRDGSPELQHSAGGSYMGATTAGGGLWPYAK